MKIDELIIICTKIRIGLENASTQKPIGCFNLEGFPHGCCKISSFIVMYCLSEYIGLPKQDFTLIANAQIGSASHAWVKYKNINIDLTADQFNAFNMPKVIVSFECQWPGIDYSTFPYHKETYSSEWYSKLVCSCEFIKSSQGLLEIA